MDEEHWRSSFSSIYDPQSSICDLLSSSSAVASHPPISRPRSNAWKNRAVNWKRPRSKPWEASAEKSPAVRRARLLSRPGVRRRRRNRMVRGTHQVHAVGATRPIPALPVAQERHPDAVEQPCAGRPRDFPEGPPRAAENAMEPQG